MVAIFAPLYPPAFRGGGPIRSIQALIESAPPALTSLVVTSDRDLNDAERLPVHANIWTSHNGVEVYYASLNSPRRLYRAMRELRRRKPTLLHFNSFMNPRLTGMPLLLWRVGFWGDARVLLAPRGEFGDGALSRRGLKKRLYIRMFRLLRIDRTVTWHSTATHETSDIRRIWGDEARIVERENDTLLPARASAPRAPHEDPIRAVFLGRIVEHKGLAIALEALGACEVPVALDIYGSREDAAYWSRCEQIAARMPSEVTVSFRGAVRPEDVRATLSHYDVLLMPTAGENFGHVIAEALSVSCAVAITPHTPWTRLVREGAGVIVADRSIANWRSAITSLARMSPKERYQFRLAAGFKYTEWSARPKGRHVWDLTLNG